MKKVVVIEDDTGMIELLSHWLGREDCAVVALSNGLEAVAFISKKDEPPQAVILDLVLPGRSGFELLSPIKSKWPETKVFVFSGSVESVSQLPEGCTDGIFFKPGGMKNLMSSIHVALQD